MYDNAATGKFTTLEGDDLVRSMNAVEGVAVIATVNEDGTPNAAVFVPMMVDADHVAMTLAANRTRENIERTRECALVYEVMDPSQTDKTQRYRGARLRLALLTEGDADYGRVAAAWPRMSPYTLLFEVTDRREIG